MKIKLTTFYLLLFLSTFFLQVKQSLSITCNSDEDSSKTSTIIAVAAVGDSVTSEISNRAGKAPHYLVFDGNGVFLKSLKNPAQNRRSGASLGVVALFKKESVKTVIAGRFGDKMKNQLEANKIEYHEHAGIVKKTVEMFIQNKRSRNVQN